MSRGVGAETLYRNALCLRQLLACESREVIRFNRVSSAYVNLGVRKTIVTTNSYEPSARTETYA